MNFSAQATQTSSQYNQFKEMQSLSINRFFSFSAILLACVVFPHQAIAETINCKELKAVVAEADNQFSLLKGKLLKKETTADIAKAQGLSEEDLNMNFDSSIFTAKKPMTGAAECNVIQVLSDDDTSKIEQTSYDCKFDIITTLTKSIRDELRNCVSGEMNEDAGEDEFVIYVNRVESGEGYNGTSVEASANTVEGLKLSVIKSICMNKKIGGCE